MAVKTNAQWQFFRSRTANKVLCSEPLFERSNNERMRGGFQQTDSSRKGSCIFRRRITPFTFPIADGLLSFPKQTLPRRRTPPPRPWQTRRNSSVQSADPTEIPRRYPAMRCAPPARHQSSRVLHWAACRGPSTTGIPPFRLL